jgi:hypothetical protein
MDDEGLTTTLAAAKELFWQARLKGIREDWLHRLTGKQTDLLPYEAVATVLRSYQHRQLTEMRTIPLDKIVGSVGRYKDFNRQFRPREGVAAYRWARVEQAMGSAHGVPPIEVYQIGDVYFVLDGNHRVSVARANGFDTIDAYVTVIPVAADIEAGDSLDEAISKAECAHFLAQTRLAEHCRDLDINFTHPGGYPQLLEHIYTHRYFMGLNRVRSGVTPPPGQERITFPAAAADWYAEVYLPIVAASRRCELLKRYPDLTEADLYLQVSARIFEQSVQQGHAPSPDAVAQEIAAEAPSPFTAAMRKLMRRLAAVTPLGRRGPRTAYRSAADNNKVQPADSQREETHADNVA